jgi:hypothetical protein
MTVDSQERLGDPAKARAREHIVLHDEADVRTAVGDAQPRRACRAPGTGHGRRQLGKRVLDEAPASSSASARARSPRSGWNITTMSTVGVTSASRA